MTLTAPETLDLYVVVMVVIRWIFISATSREYVTYTAPTSGSSLGPRLLVGGISLNVIGQDGRRRAQAPYYLALMLMAKLLMVNFSGLLFVDTSSTPWQIW
jgi:hypothetical protein